MWNEILAALAIVAMVFVGHVALPAAPKLVEAIADRIRYGVQVPAPVPAGATSTAPAAVSPAAPAAATPRISSKTPAQPAPATRPAAKASTPGTGPADKPTATTQRTAAAA